MTPRELFYETMAGRLPERLPLDIQLTPPVERRLAKMSDRQIKSDAEYVYVQYNYSRQEWIDAYARLGVHVPAHAIDYPMGMFFEPDLNATEETSHLSAHLHTLETLETIEQLESLPWPDLEDPAHYTNLRDRLTDVKNRGLIAVGGLDCSIFEHSWYLRGMENLFEDILEENPIGSWLIDFFTRRSCLAAKAFVEAGADAIRLGDDIGMQHSMLMSPDYWREHFKPGLAQIVRSAKSAGDVQIIYHTDGYVIPVIDDLIEVGIDILNPIQSECMNVKEVLTSYKDRLAFWGMIGTQTTLPFGKPEDVRKAVEEIYALAKEGARCVIAPTHVVEPEVPLENLLALMDAVYHH